MNKKFKKEHHVSKNFILSVTESLVSKDPDLLNKEIGSGTQSSTMHKMSFALALIFLSGSVNKTFNLFN